MMDKARERISCLGRNNEMCAYTIMLRKKRAADPTKPDEGRFCTQCK